MGSNLILSDAQSTTIFAPASPIMKSGVCLLRISGDLALACLRKLTSDSFTPVPRRAYLKRLTDEDGLLIDKALIIYFSAPNSFTGEDVVELNIHGSLAIIDKLTKFLLSVDGVRYAREGEFSRRAFENNKMDLSEVEGLSDLLEARTEKQHRQAVRQFDGELSIIYERWRSKLVELLAQLEAIIDFPDEDIPPETEHNFKVITDNLILEISKHLADNRVGERLREGVRIAIVGAPNTGKSSLMNYLSSFQAAIVSPYAGTTRDIIETQLNFAGYPCIISDTAGLRANSLDPIEQEGMKRAKEKSKEADLLLIMIDASNPDLEVVESYLSESKLEKLIVINKSDLASTKALEIKNQMESYGSYSVITSILELKDITLLNEALLLKIKKLAGLSISPTITRARHRELISKTYSCLLSSKEADMWELIADDIRLSADFLGQITGKVDVEEILESIFSTFCIGK